MPKRRTRKVQRALPVITGAYTISIIGVMVASGACAAIPVLSNIARSGPGTVILLALICCCVVASAIWLLVRRRQTRWVWQHRALARQQHEYAAHLAHMSELQDLLRLTPKEFELAIVELCKFWGYPNVQHTGGGGDLAADIICRDTAGNTTVVQCKRYAPDHLVGSPEVQKFIGMIVAHHHAHQGIFVTTSSYTEPALALGSTHNIRMINGTELVTHMQRFRASVGHQTLLQRGLSLRCDVTDHLKNFAERYLIKKGGCRYPDSDGSCGC